MTGSTPDENADVAAAGPSSTKRVKIYTTRLTEEFAMLSIDRTALEQFLTQLAAHQPGFVVRTLVAEVDADSALARLVESRREVAP